MKTKLPLLLSICLLALPTKLLANAWRLYAGEWFVETCNKFYWASKTMIIVATASKRHWGHHTKFQGYLKVSPEFPKDRKDVAE